MTRATGWNGRGWKGKDRIGNERKILRYAQNDNSNAVNAKELHNFPYLCRTPKTQTNPNQPKPKPNQNQSSNPKTAQKPKTPQKNEKPKH